LMPSQIQSKSENSYFQFFEILDGDVVPKAF
jgi:hypothetical protein